MSVVGFDIGNYKSSVGIARAGGIEIVANEYSDRITPTYISFTNNERHQGHSAKQQEVTNHQNTITGFKRLLARKPTDQQVQNEKNFHPLRINQSNSDKVLVDLDYLNETRSFTPEQLVGIFLTKLKSIGEMNLNTKVTDCVLSVPSYFTDAERRALLDATQIAGLNCLKLMNETTAVALTYGLYHTDLPDVNDKPHIAIFVDMGYTSLQASAVAFHKGKLRILASTFDNNLGGRDFDKVLMDYFRKEFQDKYKIDAYSNVRARLRLRTECEKIKKLMSTNASSIPLNIECFMNDIDVSARIKRDDFEQLADSLLVRVRKVIQDLLNDANLKPEDISIVEVVGGSTRVPAVKKIIQETFQKEISTTLNADEACARGCTIMCAILSPNFKVKEFKIEDCQLFPITLSWKGAETDDNELEVFPKFEKIPLSKLLTIYKRESFEIEARYRFPNNIPYNEARIGKFYIGNVTPNQQGENSEVKLKARITKNGIFEISSPQMIETFEVEVPVQEQQAEQTAKPTEQTERQTSEQSASEDATMADEQASNDASQPPKMVKKKKTKAIDLALTARVPQLSKQELNELVEQELAMIQQDRKERERSEAKNSVEEYIYEIRGKLSEQYENFITEQNKSTFMALLDETENWLYSDEAENQEKSVYVERLQSLKRYISKILSKRPYNKLSLVSKSQLTPIAPVITPSLRSRSSSQSNYVIQNKLRTLNTPAPPPRPKLICKNAESISQRPEKPPVEEIKKTPLISTTNTLPRVNKQSSQKTKSINDTPNIRSSFTNSGSSNKSFTNISNTNKIKFSSPHSTSFADLSNRNAFFSHNNLVYPSHANSNSTSNLNQINLGQYQTNQFGSQIFNYPNFYNFPNTFNYPNKGFNIQYYDRI